MTRGNGRDGVSICALMLSAVHQQARRGQGTGGVRVSPFNDFPVGTYTLAYLRRFLEYSIRVKTYKYSTSPSLSGEL